MTDKRDEMNLMKHISILISTLILLAGCSGKSGKTETAFQVRLGGLASITAAAGGGAMIYGNSAAGSFGKRIDNLGGNFVPLPIPNGVWNFSIVMWDGDNDANPGTAPVPLTGMVRCGVSLGNELNGGDVTITLDASNANCTDPVFSTGTSLSAGVTSFPEVVPRVCREDLANVTDENATECINGSEGFIHSVRYMMVPFKNIGGEIFDDFGNALIGPCISKTASPGNPLFAVRENINAVPTAANIPGGNPAFADSVFKTVVRAYYGETAECDESDPRGISDHIFPKGVNENKPNSRMITFDVGGGIKENAMLLRTPDDLACAPPRGDLQTDFSVGGTKFFLNGICNPQQFDLIPAEWTTGRTFNNKNFILLRNINYFAGVDLSAGEPSIPAHTMIGTDYVGNETADPTAYTGTFFGNARTIVGMRIDYENEANPIGQIGFVRNLGAGGAVRNLTFRMPEVWADSYEDHDNIGIVAGVISGGTVNNVTILNGSVEGRMGIGLVAGGMNAGAIQNVDSDHGEVEGVSEVGGLVGSFGGGTITDSEYRGFVHKDGPDGTCLVPGYSYESGCTNPGEGNSTWTDSNSFGGIVGVASGGSATISGSTSKGIILGSSKVGGIAGRVDTAGVTIIDSYSVASVIGTRDFNMSGSSFVGGIQGEAVANNTVTRSFHSLGSVFGPGVDVGPVTGGGAGTPALTDVLGTSTASPTHSYTQIRSAATMNGFNYTNGNGWYMDDDGYDLPRRDYEAVRPCSGKFANTFAGGDGSEANPFQICSAAQFANISTQIGSNFYYELSRPIDMSGLTPVTSNAYVYNGGTAFQGVLDGKGSVISNIYASVSSATDHVGLFSTIGTNGILKNILLVGKVDMTTATASFDAGLAAGVNLGVLDRVTTFGAVSSIGQDSKAIGGVVGTNQGVIIGTRGNSVVQGNNYVGGIAGKNEGGLIAYSVFGGRVTPKDTSVLATYLGGITGHNYTSGGSKSYYDPSYEETLTYNGSILDTSVYGELSASYGGGVASQAAMRKAGLIAGQNDSEMTNIESYGRIDLSVYTTGSADNAPVYSDYNPVAGLAFAEGTLRYMTGAGIQTIFGLAETWAAGDAVWGQNGIGVKLPAFFINTTPVTSGTTTVAPFYQFGGVVGVNTGTITNVYYNANTQYNGYQYFVNSFGQFVGENSGTITGVLTEGDFNFPGSNTIHLDVANDNYMVQRSMSGDRLIIEYDTATDDTAGTITVDTFNDLTSYITASDIIGFGSYPIVVGTVADNAPSDVTHSAPIIDSSLNPVLYVPESDLNDTNYPGFFEIDLGWSIAADYDDPTGHWRLRDSGSEAGLTRPEGYEENLRKGEYIELIQAFQ